mmetsp:Transcript_944/g.2014  ORF Transcript_944/g.2014 Transcript_944/m.2014 type:complete len:287 (-) Transcript_944:266-1126(-)
MLLAPQDDRVFPLWIALLCLPDCYVRVVGVSSEEGRQDTEGTTGSGHRYHGLQGRIIACVRCVSKFGANGSAQRHQAVPVTCGGCRRRRCTNRVHPDLVYLAIHPSQHCHLSLLLLDHVRRQHRGHHPESHGRQFHFGSRRDGLLACQVRRLRSGPGEGITEDRPHDASGVQLSNLRTRLVRCDDDGVRDRFVGPGSRHDGVGRTSRLLGDTSFCRSAGNVSRGPHCGHRIFFRQGIPESKPINAVKPALTGDEDSDHPSDSNHPLQRTIRLDQSLEIGISLQLLE